MTATLRARSTTSKLASALFQPAARTTPRTPRIGNYGAVVGVGDTTAATTVWPVRPQSHLVAHSRAYASYAFAAATQAAITTTSSFSSSAEFDDGNDENDTGDDHLLAPSASALVRLRGYETIDTADTTTNCASSTAATEIPVEAAATYELPSSWMAAETMRDLLNDSYYHASYRANNATVTAETTTAHH